MSAAQTLLTKAQAIKNLIAANKNHVSTHQLRAWRKQLKRYQYIIKNKLHANTHQHTAA